MHGAREQAARVSLALDNGQAIAAHVYEPEGTPRASAIVSCAMGVTQRFYSLFAQWLASQGYRAITFDYRGIGLSAPRSLRGFEVDVIGWARQDCAAAINYAREKLPGKPLYWIGHSLGGQLLGLIPNREQIDRVVTIATGSGYWRQNSWRTKRIVWWLWFVVAPLATKLFGYFPGKRIRKVGDLPKGVIAQWRRWCLTRDYVVGAEGEAVRAAYASVRIPMLALSFTDDEMMSAQAVRSMHALYAAAPVEYRRIAPHDVGVPRIGHFGFFRPEFAQTLWPIATEWLERDGIERRCGRDM
ncbi:MAG: alpha/beta fold hydrolase [Gammaproteobacteria bacterium]|nr:alpha/beta hydrolase [Gammaproteobacteria bacterium]